jgi:Flp pilus assembly pilin Flp
MNRSFRRDCSAATTIEYGMIVGVLGVGLLLGGAKIKDMAGGKLQELAFGGPSMRVETCTAGKPCEREAGRAAQTGGAASGQTPGVR